MFNFSVKAFEAILVIVNTVLFGLAHRHIRMTLAHSVIDRKQKRLFLLKSLNFVLAIMFFFLALNICWAIYSQGLQDVWSYINYVFYSYCYISIEAILFIMLWGLNLDWKLQT